MRFCWHCCQLNINAKWLRHPQPKTAKLLELARCWSLLIFRSLMVHIVRVVSHYLRSGSDGFWKSIHGKRNLFAIPLQTVWPFLMSFHCFRCHPMLCNYLNLRSFADSIPSALTNFQSLSVTACGLRVVFPTLHDLFEPTSKTLAQGRDKLRRRQFL